VDPARVPEKPVRPNRPLFAVIGCVGTLAISIALWLSFEMRNNKFLGEWELPEGAVVLGRVPALPTAAPGRRRLFRVLSFRGPAAVALAFSLARYLVARG